MAHTASAARVLLFSLFSLLCALLCPYRFDRLTSLTSLTSLPVRFISRYPVLSPCCPLSSFPCRVSSCNFAHTITHPLTVSKSQRCCCLGFSCLIHIVSLGASTTWGCSIVSLALKDSPPWPPRTNIGFASLFSLYSSTRQPSRLVGFHLNRSRLLMACLTLLSARRFQELYVAVACLRFFSVVLPTAMAR